MIYFPIRIFSILILVLSTLGLRASSEETLINGMSPTRASSPVVVIEIKGSINPGSADYIKSGLYQAKKLNAQLLVIKLDTPGGLLSTTREIIRNFSESEIPVAVFVHPGGASATSAGALIAMASHLAVMAPGTNIGAAHPVGAGGEEVKGPAGDKATNDTAALARSQAVLRGRNPDIAEKIVTQSLSFSAEEARKEKIIDFVVRDLQDFFAQAHLKKIKLNETQETQLGFPEPSEVTVINLPMSVKQKLLHTIADPNISTLLMALGGIAIYAEISSGFTLIIPGIFGLFCLLLGFVSLQLLPISTGGVLLFLLGLALIGAEFFVTSFGLLSIAGLVAIGLGSLFIIDPAQGGGDLAVAPEFIFWLVVSFGSIMAIVGTILWRDRKLRGQTKYLGSAMGNKQDPMAGLKGKVVVVRSDGRSGKVFIHGEYWDFVSSQPLKAEDQIVVLETQDQQLKVERA
jgi:membrane-bound serine protease (ClpP class)